ncbi:MAG: hypothetical protein JSS76_06145 [Bacteroidetes bacterium]|nr:hypothetical protein [Bacteroidota bacterium]
MKKLLTLALLPVCAALLLTVSSCGKKSTTSGNGGTVTMTFGGTTHTYKTSGTLTAVSSANEMALSADENGTGKIFTLAVLGGHTTGTYTYNAGNLIEITGSTSDPIYSTSNASGGGYSNGSMSITIGGGSGSCTFSGTLYNLQNANDSLAFTGSYSGSATSL